MTANAGGRRPVFKDFLSSTGAVTEKPKAIVPLLKYDNSGVSVVGTGFYISSLGIIVTAKHCIEEGGRVASDKGFGVLHWDLYEENTYHKRPILRGWACPTSDIAVLLTAPMNNTKTGHPIPTQSLLLSIERPPPGTAVATYAYPNTAVEKDGKTTIVQLKPKLVQGKLTDYFPAGRDRFMINWPVYETNMDIGPGCSGGPVFGESGTAFAVNTSSFDRGENERPVSYITPIDYVLDAVISNISFAESARPQDYTIRHLAQEGRIEFSPPFPTPDQGTV